MREQILVKRRLLEIAENTNENYAYFVAELINKFGVFVDKPEMLSAKNVKTVADFYGVEIPKGFYKNPQHLKYFSVEELYLEQLISYINIAIEGQYSLDKDVFERIDLFSKVLPEYKKGEEVQIRKYSLITSQEAEKFLKELCGKFCEYSRPWAHDEVVEFKWLYLNGYYDGCKIMCKDNAINLLWEYKTTNFACMLDKKDITKMSKNKYGCKKVLSIPDDDKIVFDIAIKHAKDCPMSKKQAKYYNSILKNIKSNSEKATNTDSPYKHATALMKSGDVVGASEVYAESGSLLERNLVYLLSRASLDEIPKIIDMVKVDNPIALMQIFIGLIADDYSSPRTFTFYSPHKNLTSHIETENEYKNRKSRLTVGIKKILIEKLVEKIETYYRNRKSLGKIYIDDEFEKVFIPFNTSAMGMGLDILPTGSRIKITEDYLRVFCYWNKVFDIDLSVVFIGEGRPLETLYWGNYSQKLFGNSALASGDARGKSGAEYVDFDINEIKEKGYSKAVVTLNGYGGSLDEGEIYCGYQNKKDLKTKAWSSKNIALKIHVKGETNGYVGFAIDLDTKEIIVLNQNLESGARVVNSSMLSGIKKYLNKQLLKEFNMKRILEFMGEVVDKKENADVVFARDYTPIENQKVISPYNIEDLVGLLK